MMGLNEIKKFAINIQTFKIVTLILYFLKANLVFNETLFAQVAILLTLLWGILLIIYYFFKKREFFKKPYLYVLGIFFVSYLVSIILNMHISLFDNLRDIAWFAVTVTVFMWPTSDNSEKITSDYLSLLKIYAIIAFLFAILSVPFVFANIGGRINGIRYGFYFKRLYGVYRSPNYGAIYAAVALLISIFLLDQNNKHMSNKIFYSLNIILQFLYITYSGSRSGFICLCCGVIMYGIYYIIVHHKNIKKLLVTLACISISLFICIYGMSIIKKYTAQFLNNAINGIENEELIDDETPQTSDDETPQTSDDETPQTSDDETPQTKAPTVDFNRLDTSEYGITNGRSYNWKVGFKVFKDYKLFGTTMRGYGEIAKRYDSSPRTKSEFLTLENDFISIIICTGIVGSVFMISAILIILYKLVIGLYFRIKKGDYYKIKSIWIALVIFIVIGITMAFTDAVIFSNTIQSFLFWSSLGYLLISFERGKEIEKN